VLLGLPYPLVFRYNSRTPMDDPLPIGTIADPQFMTGQVLLIPPEVRRKHLALFGMTGAGKSTLLRNMIAWDIRSGAGVTVVDPHGALIEDLLEHHIPKSRTNDVIYFSPKRSNWALGLNILEAVRPEQRALVVSQVVSIFKRLWGDSWGPRLENILRNALFALIEQPAAMSLAALPRLLTDAAYRKQLLANVTNSVVRSFFKGEYDQWKDSFREEAISSVLNKIRALLTDPMLLAILGQSRSTFDFRWMMDNRKILLCDLSKGAIGDDNANLLGSLIVIKERLAALSREDAPEQSRVQHFLYVEEAQNFVGDFGSILAEARKYRLGLILVTQGIEQLSKPDALAVFANVATIGTFRVSGEDAARLETQFTGRVPAKTYQELPDFKLYVRTMIPNAKGVGYPSGPHAVDAFPPFKRIAGMALKNTVIRTSLARYSRPRAEVAEKLAKFLTTKPKKDEPSNKEPRPNPTITRLKRIEAKIDTVFPTGSADLMTE
jgi:type IV secretory pathway TraG/TraD family ATPase VirD4